MRILIAEDTAETRHLYASVLRQSGHGVIVVEDGAQAVYAAQTYKFDVLVIDVQMPGLDGLGAIQQIRALPYCRTVPIIVVTAYACTEQEAQEAGANLLLKKPVGHQELVQHVEGLSAIEPS